MPPQYAMPNGIDLSSRDGAMITESTRRRRTHSKDMDVRNAKNERTSSIPLNHPRSPTRNGHSRRRKGRAKGQIYQKVCVYVFDLLILAYLIRSIRVYLRPRTSDESSKSVPSTSVLDSSKQPSHPFTKVLDETRICGALLPDEVTFSLAMQLSDNRLWMMQHHCELWGPSASISIAMWTSLPHDEIMEKLKQMGCDLEVIKLQTLSSENKSGVDFPINELRNMALRGVTTSHALLLDIDLWESADLFDTLNLPSVRKALSEDSKLGMVIPAFETQDLNCGSSSYCRVQQLSMIPRDFEDLVISLGANRTLPYDPMHFTHQGSTNYRQWMRLNHGELFDIGCVSSNQYQPYVVVRLCDDIPPFQEIFSGYGRNHMEWMLHLRRIGFRLKLVGGSFVTHFPHPMSQARLEWGKNFDDGEKDIARYLRGRTDKLFVEFSKWLEANVPNDSRLEKCEGFGDDEESLLYEER